MEQQGEEKIIDKGTEEARGTGVRSGLRVDGCVVSSRRCREKYDVNTR